MSEERGARREARLEAPEDVRASRLPPPAPTQARPAIDVARVSKIYRRYSQRKQFTTLKSALLSRSLIRDLKPDETFTALNDISLTVPKGRTPGGISRNGAGKSTPLKLVPGSTKPATGMVKVDGP